MPLARRGRTARSTGTGAWANNSGSHDRKPDEGALSVSALRLKDITIPSFADAFAELNRLTG